MTTSGRVRLGDGIEYLRRSDGFTLRVEQHGPVVLPAVEVHLSDDLFDSLLLLQNRHRGQGDPSLTAGDLNRVADYGFEKGGVSGPKPEAAG